MNKRISSFAMAFILIITLAPAVFAEATLAEPIKHYHIRKYGWANQPFHDTAIVYANSPYILVILSAREKV